MKVFDLVPSWIYVAIIGVLLAVVGFEQVRVADLRTDIATLQAARDKEAAARASAALQYVNQLDQQRDEHALAQAQQEKTNVEKIKALENDKAVALADARRMRDQLAAYTTGGRRPGETDTALIQRLSDRLEVVGGLLSESIDLVTESRAVVANRDREVGVLLNQIKIDRQACSPES